jgi:hypothetical protein
MRGCICSDGALATDRKPSANSDVQEIVYESSALDQLLRPTIKFRADGPEATVVTVTDSQFELDEEGVERALGQNADWTYTLNLRTGLNKRLADL